MKLRSRRLRIPVSLSSSEQSNSIPVSDNLFSALANSAAEEMDHEHVIEGLGHRMQDEKHEDVLVDPAPNDVRGTLAAAMTAFTAATIAANPVRKQPTFSGSTTDTLPENFIAKCNTYGRVNQLPDQRKLDLAVCH